MDDKENKAELYSYNIDWFNMSQFVFNITSIYIERRGVPNMPGDITRQQILYSTYMELEPCWNRVWII